MNQNKEMQEEQEEMESSSFSSSTPRQKLVPSEVIDEEPELTTDIEQSKFLDEGCLDKLYSRITLGEKLPTILRINANSINLIFLTLPYIIEQTGLVMAIILAIILYILNNYTINLICLVFTKSENLVSYFQMLKLKINNWVPYTFLSFNLIFNLSSIMMMEYFIYVFSLQIFKEYEVINEHNLLLIKWVTILIWIILQCIVALLYNPKFIFLSYIQTFEVFMCLIAMIIKIIIDLDNIKITTSSKLQFFNFDIKYFYCIPILQIMFNNHNDFFYLFKKFKMHTQKRVCTATGYSYKFIILFSLTFMILGYFFDLSFKENNERTISNIISMFFADDFFFKTFGWFFFVINLGFVISLHFLMSVKIHQIKEELKIVFSIFRSNNNNRCNSRINNKNYLKINSNNFENMSNNSNKNRPINKATVLLKVLIVIITNLFIPLIKSILTIIGICGGIGCCFSCFVFPLITYEMVAKSNRLRTILNYCLAIISGIFGISFTIFSLINSVSIKKNWRQP